MNPSRILPDLQCSLVCDGIRQETTGNLILLGVMDRILSQQYPVQLGQIFIVNRWTAGKGQFTQVVKILAADQTTVLHKSESKMALADPIMTATNVHAVAGLNLSQPGPYWVEILIDDVMKLRYAVPAYLVQQQAPQAGKPPGA
jgi:hypothetical protein